MMPPHDRSWREYVPDQPHPEIPYQCPVTFGPRSHHWQGPACENGKECAGLVPMPVADSAEQPGPKSPVLS